MNNKSKEISHFITRSVYFAAFIIFVLIATLLPLKMIFAAKITDHETVIENIREKLVAALQKVPLEIKSTAWIDESGTLQETTKFESEAKISGIRIENYSKSEINFNRTIEIKNLNYSFNKQNNIFEKFNTTIKKNSFNVITGESGAGKSTLINIIMGLIKPDKGTIEVDGKNIYENLNSWHEKIAYVPQKINLLDNTLAKNIAFGEKDEEINNKK